MPNASVHHLFARYSLSRHRAKLRMRLLAILPLAVIVALTSCGATPTYYHTATGMCRDYTWSYPPEASFTCYVTFAPTVTYAQALRMLTDVGMQPSLHCWSVNGFALWQPVGQRDLFAQWHSLIVLPNTDGPNPFTGRSWVDELRFYLPGVVALHEATPEFDARYQLVVSPTPRYFVGATLATDDTVGYTCPPSIHGADVSPSTLIMLQQNALTYARISFAPAISYDAALYDTVNLGLWLADPCYETYNPIATQTPKPSYVQGQEVGFARTHSLVVTPGSGASNLWQRQARGLAGATGEADVGGSVCV
ncbi:MAG TPA: hypothetical protein VMV29_01050 [Ktedonobacterales bacterium]|nr:hypothetical protein [Ktedonobacterales bacterium]